MRSMVGGVLGVASKKERRAFEGERPAGRWRGVEEACCTFRRPFINFENGQVALGE